MCIYTLRKSRSFGVCFCLQKTKMTHRKEAIYIGYAILRFEKHKGANSRPLEAHHERLKEKYESNPDIDLTRRNENYHIIKPKQPYNKEMNNRIEQAGCKTRKDSVKFIDTLITASPEFFEDKSPKAVKAFFHYACEFIKKEIGASNVFSAVVHMDEKTPNMHLCFTPITEDGRLSAKEILGNKKKMSEWQDKFHEAMAEKFPSLERGKSSQLTGRKPIPMKPGSVRKEDAEYARKGTCSIFVFSEPLTGWVDAHARERRTKVDWALEIRWLLTEVYPEKEKVCLVSDNLNTHVISSLYEAFPAPEARELAKRLEMYHTPKHGSWLNVAEIQISILARQCLCRRIPDLLLLNRQLTAWAKSKANPLLPVNWQFTTQDARIKLKYLYPIF